MATQLNSTEILSIKLTSTRDTLAVASAGKVKLAQSYTTLLSVRVSDRVYVVAYSKEMADSDVYVFAPSDEWLKPAGVKMALGAGKDILNIFTLGDKPHLTTYTEKDGTFTTYGVRDDLSLSKPYVFYRSHELAISKGFSTVKFFTQLGQVVFLGYNKTTGYVAMYTASITPVSPGPGELPLVMLPIWSHPWAPSWVRFAFFQFGGENFFLKTNIGNPQNINVNIDHVMDILTAGTAEVGTGLQLAKALDLTNVEPFTLRGDPYFAAYLSGTGELTLYRFHSDCRGWTAVARCDAPTGASVMTPIAVSDSEAVLVFS